MISTEEITEKRLATDNIAPVKLNSLPPPLPYYDYEYQPYSQGAENDQMFNQGNRGCLRFDEHCLEHSSL